MEKRNLNVQKLVSSLLEHSEVFAAAQFRWEAAQEWAINARETLFSAENELILQGKNGPINGSTERQREAQLWALTREERADLKKAREELSAATSELYRVRAHGMDLRSISNLLCSGFSEFAVEEEIEEF